MRIRLNHVIISRLMLAVMLFVSIAPGISYALASMTGNPSFAQQICTSDGKKVVIQVKTTMGKQLSTELNVKPSANSDNDDRHVAHCAFCTNPHTQDAMPVSHALMVKRLEFQAWQMAANAVTPVYQQYQLRPPSQAPPIS